MNGKDKILQLAYMVQADECRRSFFYFLKTFWDVIIKEQPVFNWHIEYLCHELQTLSGPIVKREPKLYDLIVNIPPGTTKSTITTIMWPAWLWTQDATLRIITNSYSGNLAIEHAVKSKDIITSDKYRKLFPEIELRRDKSAKGSYENTLTGARYTTSTGGTITGIHAHVIINDDPMNPKQALSEPMRIQALEHTKTLSSRKVNKAVTPVVSIMQRLHEKDVTGYLLSIKKGADKIKHICLPAESSDLVNPPELKEKYKNGLLDEVRLNREVLADARTDLGSREYSGQYEQNPVSDKGNIVKKEWFGKIQYHEFKVIHHGEPIVFFLDTAYTKDNDNDPSGVIATCKIGNKLYITHGKKVLYEFPALIKFIPDYVKQTGYNDLSTIRIEPKASGLSVIQQLQSFTNLNITETPTPKEDKTTRLRAASPFVECGRVILLDDPIWTDGFIDEVCGFPTRTHDEYVDLLCYAIDYHLKDDALINQNEIFNAFA